MYLSFTYFTLFIILIVRQNYLYYFITSFYHFPFLIIIQLIFGSWKEGKILLGYEQNDQEFH